MEDIFKHLDNLKASMNGIKKLMDEKITELQQQNPNLSAEITTDFNNIFQLAKDGNLNALNELKNKYQSHANNSNI